jgi:hypothetical protein
MCSEPCRGLSDVFAKVSHVHFETFDDKRPIPRGIRMRGILNNGIGLMGSGGAVADWWLVAGKTCVAAYQPKGAASLANSYINLANPGTGNAAPGTPPTLDADGWVLNGIDQYLLTGYTPTATSSMLARFSNGASGGNRILIGTYKGAGSDFAVFQTTGGKTYYVSGNSLIASSVEALSGVLGVAAKKGYRDGSPDGTIAGGAITVSSELFIGRNNGAVEYWCPCKIQAIVIYSDTLTDGEMATQSAKMAAL